MTIDSKAASPLVLATFFDGDPQEGGGYTHKRKLLELLQRLQSPHLRVTVICNSKPGLALAQSLSLGAVLHRRSRLRTFLCRILALNPCKRLFGRWIAHLPFTLDALLDRLKADLVFFTSPDDRALELDTHPFVLSVWDLCHLDHPEFPEVSHHGEFERREYFLSNSLRKAAAVLVDSEHGRTSLQQYYGVPASRVYAAPFLIYGAYYGFVPHPEETARIKARYRLSDAYIFYPAQLWPHKNHKYILEAVWLLARNNGWAPQVVLSGSDKGALQQLLAYARKLGIEEYVNYLGFVPDSDMPYLYTGALALVMPTYFGPTNIPPLEAAALGVPVCYSDFESFRAQLGEHAIYVDLGRPQSLAEALETARAMTEADRERRAVSFRAEHAGDEDRYLETVRAIVSRHRVKTKGIAQAL